MDNEPVGVDETGLPEFSKIKIDASKMKTNVPYEFEIKIPTESGLNPIKVYALKTEEGFIKIGQTMDDFSDY